MGGENENLRQISKLPSISPIFLHFIFLSFNSIIPPKKKYAIELSFGLKRVKSCKVKI
jgi:hypothetical protein